MNDDSLNELTVQVFEQYSTTPVRDPAKDLARIQIDSFETIYPNGLFGPARLSIDRDVTAQFPYRGGHRVSVTNGLKVVYQGELLNPVFQVDRLAQGVRFECIGHWGALMGKTVLNKPWADSRITQDAWEYDETTSAGNKCRIDRQNRIKLIPTTDAWTSGEYAQVVYTAPTGQTIKQIDYDYKLNESSQQWEIAWYDATNGKVSIATASGTATGQTYTPATPVQAIAFRMYAGANQTPGGNNNHIGKIENITVYTETSSINLYEIALDVQAAAGNLNSDVTHIASGATLSIEPFITDGNKPLSDILNQAAAFGDSSGNSYAPYLREAELASTYDGKPVLVVEQYPSIDDYDYAIRLDEENLVPPFNLPWMFQDVENWIVVQYRDNGIVREVTPDDDATLKDTTSISKWGQRANTRPLNAGDTTEANAIALGVRYLTYHSIPRFTVSGPITVRGWIRSNGKGIIPACQIQAGKRLKFENFLEDLAQEAGAGLTFLIGRTVYRPGTRQRPLEQCSIYTGVLPDDLSMLLAQRQLGARLQ